MALASEGQIKWHTLYIPRATKKALTYLSKQKWIQRSKWYLAGGTALALQAGHRVSVDLDFFTPLKTFSIPGLLTHFSEDIWISDILKEDTVYGRIFKAKASFIAYPFFYPVKAYKWYGCVSVLDQHDIAVMKIIAISQRGRKRDFVDLYWYCNQENSLLNLITCLPKQYPTVAHDFHHILKSLTFFDDAEQDPMPKLFFKASWKQIKVFFQTQVPLIARELLDLK